MAQWPGFCGPSYKLESPNGSPDETINFYTETLERGPRQGQTRLRQIPGLSILPGFVTESTNGFPAGPIQALYASAGGARLFAVAGGGVFEVFQPPANPPYTLLGNVGLATNPATMAANGFQLAIASGGQLYITNLGTTGPGVIPVVDTTGQEVVATAVNVIDQYFVISQPNTKIVQISNLAPNGGIWDPADEAEKEGYADNIQRVWVDAPGGELLYLHGTDTMEIWQDTGGLFPFQRISGCVFPVGCDSAWSIAGINGLHFWLWRGQIWVTQGTMAPVVVSDWGVEQQIKQYSWNDWLNAEGFSYLQGHHVFYVISFPFIGETWCLDFTEKAWHRRLYWQNGVWTRYRPRVYANAFGLDIVGDYATNMLYVLDPTVATDATVNGVTAPLRRERIAPYLTSGMTNVRHNRMTLDMDTGVGLQVPVGHVGQNPQCQMRYSKDRGKNWSLWRQDSIGAAGLDQTRVFWPQMGSSRIGLTVDLVITDPVITSINAAYIDENPGTWPRP